MRRQAVLGLLTLVGILRLSKAQLSSAGSAFNPLSGQGAPPNATQVGLFFPVKTGVFIQSLLAVNENSYSFDLNFLWMLEYEDPRAYDIIMNSDSDECSFYCSSLPNAVLNAEGENACCEGVYVPQADSVNLRGYDAQTFPYRYELHVTENGTVSYASQVQGTWSCAFDYGAYPWDRHYLVIDIYTSFNPIIDDPNFGAGFLAVDGNVIDSDDWGPVAPTDLTKSRPSSTSLALPGWAVKGISALVMSFTEHVSLDPQNFEGGSRTDVLEQLSTSPGLRVAIEIQRETRIFYCVIVILPIALIVLFAFGMFSMGRAELKARVMLLATQFLTLIILQFVLSSILPASYTLLAPYILVIVSYVYTFVLFCIAIVSHSLLKQPERRSRRHRRQAARHHFREWQSGLHERAGLQTNLRRRKAAQPSPSALEEEYRAQGLHSQEVALPTATADSESESDNEQDAAQHFAFRVQANSAQEDKPDDRPWIPSVNDYAWYQRQQDRLYFKFGLFRWLAMWYKFIGMQRARAYVEHVSHRLEYWSRLALLLMYVATLGVIFGIAATRVQSSADYHVLPSAKAVQALKSATNLAN